jgi:hypothetical protein
MITGNVLAVVTPSLKAMIEKIRQDLKTHVAYQGGDEDVTDSALKTLAHADGQLLALGKEEELIQADGDSSDEGKRKQMIRAVGRTYEALGFVKQAALQKADAATDAKKTLTETPKAQTDPLIDALRCFEVRQLLRPMTEAERMKLYEKAVTGKHVAIIRAIDTNPMLETLVPVDWSERIQNEHLARAKRGEWSRLQSLTYVAERLTMLANALEYALGNYGNTPTFPTPPIKHVDLWTKNQQSPPSKSPADAPTREQFQ